MRKCKERACGVARRQIRAWMRVQVHCCLFVRSVQLYAGIDTFVNSSAGVVVVVDVEP